MTSLILRTATTILSPLLLFMSLFLLFRGHNQPGGGFVGGLMAATAFSLWAIAYDVRQAYARLGIDPHLLVGIGLVLAIASAWISWMKGLAFMTSQWFKINVPLLGSLEFSTPMVFDIGVYLVVLGVLMMMILNLAEE